MTYNNLQDITTTVEAVWTNTPIDYSSITLEAGIPHKDQLQVERIFTLPTSPTNVKDGISGYDLHRVFLLEATEYTVNETNKTITGFNITAGARNYFTVKPTATVPISTSIAIPVVSTSETVIIRRKTYSAAGYVNWTSGSRLTSAQLNLQTKQLLNIVQELTNKLDSEYIRFTDVTGNIAPALNVNNSLNLNSNLIINQLNPAATYGTDTTTGVNKGYIESHFLNRSQNQAQTINGVKTFQNNVIMQGDLTVDTNTLFVDASSNRVGVKTNSPVANYGLTVLDNIYVGNGSDLSPSGTGLGHISINGDGYTGYLTLDNTDMHIGHNASSRGITFDTNETTRITIPSDSSGIRFPSSPTASTDANTLDSYAEGSWTPKLQFSGSSSPFTLTDPTNLTYSAQQGQYVKIGKLVECVGRITINATGTNGTNTQYLVITGLPFVSDTSVVTYSGGLNTLYTNANIGLRTTISGYMVTLQGITRLYLCHAAITTTTGTPDTVSNISLVNTTADMLTSAYPAGKDIIFKVTYFAAS